MPKYPYLDENGHEIVDPVPMEIPLGKLAEPSMFDRMRALIRSEALAREAAMAGAETFEEANDFDIPDGDDPFSPYEDLPSDLDGVPASAGTEDPPAPPPVPSTAPAGGAGAAGTVDVPPVAGAKP